MNLYRVAHWHARDEEDDEPRVAAVMAEKGRRRSRASNKRFEVWDAIEGQPFAGPARVAGLEGAPAFSWK